MTGLAGAETPAREKVVKLSHLRILVAAVERGSMRSASRQLNIPQPVISRSIQQLEAELGVKLFERTPSGLIVTQVGEMVIRRAKVIQSELQRTLEEVDQFKGVEVGTISLGLSTAAHVAVLPRIFRPFHRRFPKVRLNIVEGLFPILESDIRDGLVDIYVGPVERTPQSGDLLIEPMFANERIIVGRVDHPLANASSIKDLANAEWVTTPVASDTENEVNAIFEAVGMPPPAIAAQAKSWLSIMSIVASSDLLAPMPQQWQAFIAATNLVVRLPVRETTYAPAICTVRQARLPLTPAAQYLSDLIHRAAANHARTMAPPVGQG